MHATLNARAWQWNRAETTPLAREAPNGRREKGALPDAVGAWGSSSGAVAAANRSATAPSCVVTEVGGVELVEGCWEEP